MRNPALLALACAVTLAACDTSTTPPTAADPGLEDSAVVPGGVPGITTTGPGRTGLGAAPGQAVPTAVPAGATCSTVTFEGVGNLLPVGAIAGTFNVAFGADWLGLVDYDDGGNGNFSFEPSPSTVGMADAYELGFPGYDGDLDVTFDAGANYVELWYVNWSPSQSSVRAWDADGNLVDETALSEYYNDGCSAGDPTGTGCNWTLVSLSSAANDIVRLSWYRISRRSFIIDDLSVCAQLTIAVDIDIKPGSADNPVNLKAKNGVIPVAVLTDAGFDATTIDASTVAFGPAGAAPAHGGHIEDVDGDGDLDTVFHFRTADAGIACGDAQAALTGQTSSGDAFEGSDAVWTNRC